MSVGLECAFGVHKETFQMSDAHPADLAEANGNQVPFFVVSPMKFGVMTFFTLGFYWVYCFYQSWSLHREKTGERVSPLWRSAFAVFFIYPLLRRANDHIRDSGKTYPWSILGLTLGYYGFCVVWVALRRRVGRPAVAGLFCGFSHSGSLADHSGVHAEGHQFQCG